MSEPATTGNGNAGQALALAGLLGVPELKRERANRLARERRARRNNYNSGSKYDRLSAYSENMDWDS